MLKEFSMKSLFGTILILFGTVIQGRVPSAGADDFALARSVGGYGFKFDQSMGPHGEKNLTVSVTPRSGGKASKSPDSYGGSSWMAEDVSGLRTFFAEIPENASGYKIDVKPPKSNVGQATVTVTGPDGQSREFEMREGQLASFFRRQFPNKESYQASKGDCSQGILQNLARLQGKTEYPNSESALVSGGIQTADSKFGATIAPGSRQLGGRDLSGYYIDTVEKTYWVPHQVPPGFVAGKSTKVRLRFAFPGDQKEGKPARYQELHYTLGADGKPSDSAWLRQGERESADEVVVTASDSPTQKVMEVTDSLSQDAFFAATAKNLEALTAVVAKGPPKPPLPPARGDTVDPWQPFVFKKNLMKVFEACRLAAGEKSTAIKPALERLRTALTQALPEGLRISVGPNTGFSTDSTAAK
jgi:hypothetical protein